MKKVYNVTFHNTIRAVEITRETVATVWIKNSAGKEVASKKRTSDGWNDFFETAEEARQHIIKYNQRKIEECKRNIILAELHIKNALEWSEK